MQKSVLDQINQIYDSLYEQERKVALYILKNHEAVINMTISELAEASGTSVATVTRFCRKCDLTGFHQLKVGLAREIVTDQDRPVKVSNDLSRDQIEQSLQNILANKIEELTQTVNMIDPQQLETILELFENANLVQFVAVGNTIPAALDGAFKFNQIGIHAVSGTIWETQLVFTQGLTEKDVLVAISNSGESRHVVMMVEEAKKRGATTIGITNNPHSQIGELVDYHIQTATREKLFLNEFCFSRVSAFTIIEIFYLLLTVGNSESYSSLSRSEALIADDKV